MSDEDRLKTPQATTKSNANGDAANGDAAKGEGSTEDGVKQSTEAKTPSGHKKEV